MGKQGHAPCKTSSSKYPHVNKPEGWGGRHLPTIRRKVLPRILERASLVYSMLGGGVGVMVKEVLCEKMVEVRRVSDDSCCF